MDNKTVRVTIKEIAEASGTSIGTVDRALRNRKGISNKTKERILKTAKEMGYMPNPAASALGRKKRLKIAVIYAKEPKGFYDLIDKGIKDAAKELYSFGVDIDTIKSDRLDPNEQGRVLQSMDFDHYNGILINYAGLGTEIFIDYMTEKGIPVVTFNSDSWDSSRLFFVGNDPRKSGKIAGELLSKFIKTPEEILIIGNFKDTYTFKQRLKGFNESVEKNCYNIKNITIKDCLAQPDNAYEIAKESLKMSKIGGIATISYAATLGVARLLDDSDNKKIPFVGYDISREIAKALTNGYCDAVIYQDPYKQAYHGISMLAKYLTENYTPKEKLIYVKSKIIIESNLTDYYID